MAHEAKFRWALEAIRDGAHPSLAAQVLEQAAALDADAEHRYHHVFPHPNGGTWPHAQQICTCTEFDSPDDARYFSSDGYPIESGSGEVQS